MIFDDCSLLQDPKAARDRSSPQILCLNSVRVQDQALRGQITQPVIGALVAYDDARVDVARLPGFYEPLGQVAIYH